MQVRIFVLKNQNIICMIWCSPTISSSGRLSPTTFFKTENVRCLLHLIDQCLDIASLAIAGEEAASLKSFTASPVQSQVKSPAISYSRPRVFLGSV